MKVIILTFSKEYNRGANLQSYALFSFFKSKGIDVEFLDIRLPSPGFNLKGKVYNYINNRFAERFRKKQGFRFTRKYETVDELMKDAPEADVYVVGSDQVWNPDIISRLDPLVYFLSFVKGNGKRVAYAASFGKGTWSVTPYDEEIKRELHRFDAVSVRETSGLAVCRDVFGLENVEVTLDPVLLLDQKKLRSVMGGFPEKGNHIFSYLLYSDDNSYALIERIANVLTCKVSGGKRHPSVWSSLGRLYGIKTWLRKIGEAEFVVTNSFHCMVCCILLMKKFVAIPPVSGRGTRMISLLSKLGLEDRYVTDSADLENKLYLLTEKIDYEAVFRRLECEREKSVSFLNRVIGG